MIVIKSLKILVKVEDLPVVLARGHRALVFFEAIAFIEREALLLLVQHLQQLIPNDLVAARAKVLQNTRKMNSTKTQECCKRAYFSSRTAVHGKFSAPSIRGISR